VTEKMEKLLKRVLIYYSNLLLLIYGKQQGFKKDMAKGLPYNWGGRKVFMLEEQKF
jgi:hypothetical protein